MVWQRLAFHRKWRGLWSQKKLPRKMKRQTIRGGALFGERQLLEVIVILLQFLTAYERL